MSKRNKITTEQMKAVKVHDSWSDGRTGYLFARVTACLTNAPDYINAEVVWDDNESIDDDDNDVSDYYDPHLEIETNDPEDWGDGEVARNTRNKVVLKLTVERAIELMEGDPKVILSDYADDVARLLALDKRSNQ